VLSKKPVKISLLILTFISCASLPKRIIYKDLPAEVVCPTGTNVNKKIVILYNNSGSAHVSASKSLAHILGPEYCVSFIDFSADIIAKAWRIYPDKLYNAKLKQRKFSRLNFMSRNTMPLLLKFSNWRTIRFLREEISKKKPDLVISTIPFINSMVINVAKEKAIPVVVVGLDQDLTNWLQGVDASLLKGANIKFTLDTTSSPIGVEQLAQIGISSENIINTGFPIRRSFREAPPKDLARKKMQIGDDKFVVLVMFGGSASNFMISLAKEFKQNNNKQLHILLVAGGNEEIKEKLKNYVFPKGVTAEIFGFVENIAEMMSASDLFIGKPGSLSVYEAIHLKLPMILDLTKGAMTHELATANFIKDMGLGLLLKDIVQLNSLIDIFSTEETYENYKKNFNKIAIKNFDTEFMNLIKNHLLL